MKLNDSDNSGVILCISDFQKSCVSKTAGLRVKDISRSLCYSVLCGHCLPSCQAKPLGFLFSYFWPFNMVVNGDL